MNCPSCATELPSPNFKFCPFCGAATGTAPVKPSARPATPQRGVRSGVAPAPEAATKAPSPAAPAMEGRPNTAPATPTSRTPERSHASVADTLPEPAPAIRVSSPVNEEVRLGRRPDAEAATVFEIPAVDAAALASSLQRKHESHSKMEAALTTG